jgi:hypothetical protein
MISVDKLVAQLERSLDGGEVGQHRLMDARWFISASGGEGKNPLQPRRDEPLPCATDTY